MLSKISLSTLLVLLLTTQYIVCGGIGTAPAPSEADSQQIIQKLKSLSHAPEDCFTGSFTGELHTLDGQRVRLTEEEYSFEGSFSYEKKNWKKVRKNNDVWLKGTFKGIFEGAFCVSPGQKQQGTFVGECEGIGSGEFFNNGLRIAQLLQPFNLATLDSLYRNKNNNERSQNTIKQYYDFLNTKLHKKLTKKSAELFRKQARVRVHMQHLLAIYRNYNPSCFYITWCPTQQLLDANNNTSLSPEFIQYQTSNGEKATYCFLNENLEIIDGM